MLSYNIEKECRFVLASASPRRVEMFRREGFSPEVYPARVEEGDPGSLSVEETVMFLALKKALWVEREILREAAEGKRPAQLRYCIVAADTVVFREGIIGKPKDEADALRILEDLRGREHSVASGVALLEAGRPRRLLFCEKSLVRFGDYSREEILDYIASGEPMDKAGAYAIQGGWAPHIREFRGSRDNIIGFPWERFEHEFRAFWRKDR